MNAETITIELTLGNDKFQTPEDVARGLRELAEKFERRGFDDHVLLDANGSRVGRCDVRYEKE